MHESEIGTRRVNTSHAPPHRTNVYIFSKVTELTMDENYFVLNYNMSH